MKKVLNENNKRYVGNIVTVHGANWACLNCKFGCNRYIDLHSCQDLVMKVIKMFCPYCGKKARWCENKEVYGRNYGRSYMCYYCKSCDAYVGCHNNSKTPMGTMANKKLRSLRNEVHRILDPIWQETDITRSQLYEMISEEFGGQWHTGWAREEHCRWFLDELDIDKMLGRNK